MSLKAHKICKKIAEHWSHQLETDNEKILTEMSTLAKETEEGDNRVKLRSICFMFESSMLELGFLVNKTLILIK